MFVSYAEDAMLLVCILYQNRISKVSESLDRDLRRSVYGVLYMV